MTLRCAIIDDEPLAAELLASYANKTPFLKLTGTYNSAINGIKDLRDNRGPAVSRHTDAGNGRH